MPLPGRTKAPPAGHFTGRSHPPPLPQILSYNQRSHVVSRTDKFRPPLQKTLSGSLCTARLAHGLHGYRTSWTHVARMARMARLSRCCLQLRPATAPKQTQRKPDSPVGLQHNANTHTHTYHHPPRRDGDTPTTLSTIGLTHPSSLTQSGRPFSV